VPLWFGSVALSSRRRAHGFGLKCLADHLFAAAGQPGWAVHRARQLQVDCLDTMLKAAAGQFLPGNWPVRRCSPVRWNAVLSFQRLSWKSLPCSS
jgi:hypothetical protein